VKKPHVEIYTTATCGYCHQAKQLLDHKGIQYTEIRIDLDPEKRQEMLDRTGRRTVPEILVDDKLIGGFDDLWSLEQSGKLSATFG
jgi:glutaredoxin 3